MDFPIAVDFTLDWRVLLFTFGTSCLTGLLFGIIPALQATKGELVPGLKNDASSGRFRRWHLRDVLVGAQIALSVTLLVASVLVVRSLQHAMSIHLGFNPKDAVAASFELGLQGYDAQRGREFQRRVIEKVASLPGVAAAGVIDAVPLSLDNSTTTIFPEGRPAPRASDVPSASYYSVSPGYFHTAQTRLIAGRDFNERDREGAPLAAVVNQAFAAQIYPNEDAIGKRFRYGIGGNLIQIVGIVEDGKYVYLSEAPTPVVFRPLGQSYNSTTTLVVRSTLPADEVLRNIQKALGEMDPALPIYDAGSLIEHLKLPLFPARLAAISLGAFGGLAIILAATGVYGVMAYAVSRRTREIGIRMAVGAQASQVLLLVVRRTALLLALGMGVGALAAFGAGGFLSKILYGVSPKDPATYLLAAGLMTLVVFAACSIPARRAMRVDPLTALREE